jgi:hypothetical protein
MAVFAIYVSLSAVTIGFICWRKHAMSSLYSTRYCSALACTLLMLVVGCGGKGDVSGQVSYKGKPLVFGTVQIEALDKTFKQGIINRDGSYLIEGVPVGEAKVAVNSPNPKSGDFQPLQREGRPPPPPRPEIPGWFPIPTEYQDLSKPRLSYTVKTGDNTFNIELK